jgi:hypothetical protein
MTSGDLVDTDYGKAIEFDGVGDYIDCGNDSSLNPGESSFTVEALVKTNGQSTYGDYRDNMAVVSKGTTGDNPLYNLLIRESSGYLQATIEGSGDQADLTGSVSTQDNIDHNIAMVVNRATSEMEVFVDGLADTNTGFSDVGDINPSQSFKIGTYASSPYEYYYKDIIAELRISKNVRSSAWIKATNESLTNLLLTYDDTESLTWIYSGYLKKEGIPISRTVRLHNRSTGEIVDESISDPSTGYFELASYTDTICYAVFMPELEDDYNMMVRDKISLVYMGYA